jgi:hypothetical protein
MAPFTGEPVTYILPSSLGVMQPPFCVSDIYDDNPLLLHYFSKIYARDRSIMLASK